MALGDIWGRGSQQNLPSGYAPLPRMFWLAELSLRRWRFETYGRRIRIRRVQRAVSNVNHLLHLDTYITSTSTSLSHLDRRRRCVTPVAVGRRTFRGPLKPSCAPGVSVEPFLTSPRVLTTPHACPAVLTALPLWGLWAKGGGAETGAETTQRPRTESVRGRCEYLEGVTGIEPA